MSQKALVPETTENQLDNQPGVQVEVWENFLAFVS